MKKPINLLVNALASVFERFGLLLSKSQLFARMSNTKVVSSLSHHKVAMAVPGSLLRACEIWAFFGGWALILTGFTSYIVMRAGIVDDQRVAIAGLMLMLAGGLITMTIDWVRWIYAGKRWHIVSFALGVMAYMYPVQFLYFVGLTSMSPQAALALFCGWALLIHMIWTIIFD